MITVVLVDDHPLFRDGLRFTLEQADGIDVVAEASDGHEALASAEEHRPDVVVMDLAMPRIDGLDATAHISADRHARARADLQRGGRERARGDARGGARATFAKEPTPTRWSVRSVPRLPATPSSDPASRAGCSTCSPTVDPRRDRFPELSVREREILEHLAGGASNREIAELLVISPITVRNHVSSILAKLHLTNRREAMVRYRDGDGDGDAARGTRG